MERAGATTVGNRGGCSDVFAAPPPAVASPSASAGSSATTTPRSHPSAASSPSLDDSSASSSVLFQLEHIVMSGGVDDAGYLPLLWSAVEESARALTGCGRAHSGAVPTANGAGDGTDEKAVGSVHTQLVRDATGLLWGADYPSWMEAQWVRLGDAGEEEGEEEEEEDSEGGDRAPSPPPFSHAGLAEATAGTSANIRAGDCARGALRANAAESPAGSAGRATGAEPVADDLPQQAVPDLSFMMQHALEAFQLSLPLHEAPALPVENAAATPSESAPPPSSSHYGARSPVNEGPQRSVDLLAKHLMEDAPLLWLRHLLVPMYLQWTQRCTNTSSRTAQGGAGAGAVCSHPSSAEWGGASVMHRLLQCLCEYGLQEALRREQQLAAEVLEHVRQRPATAARGSASSRDGPAASSCTAPLSLAEVAAARATLGDVQRRQRQHVSELLCFSGTLARAAQSFKVLSSGGFTLLTVFAVRLLGLARAMWVEWASTRTAVELSRSGPLRTMLSSDAGRGTGTVMYLRDVSLEKHASDDEEAVRDQQREGSLPPPSKRHRAECSAAERSGQDSGEPSVADTLAALRHLLTTAAREHGMQLWRCWLVLFGLYGSDVYTNEAVAQALEDEELEKAEVRRMSGAQQAQWRKARMAARVKQHALSETHWLLCQTIVVYVETAMEGSLAVEKTNDGSTTVLYRRLMAETLRSFFKEVRDALRLYGQAMSALRSGGLQDSVTVVSAELQSVINNAPVTQHVFQCVLAGALRGAPTNVAAAATAPAKSRRLFGQQAGLFIWRLYPVLLRTQVPEEASWMSSSGGCSSESTGAVGAFVGAAGDDGEVAVAEFTEQQHTHWRRQGAQLSATLGDAAARVELLLTRAEEVGASSASPTGVHDGGSRNSGAGAAAGATNAASEGVTHQGDDGTLGGYADLMQLLEGAVFDGVVERAAGAAAASAPDPLSPPPAAAAAPPLDGIARGFFSVYDASCFFVLQPERQRLFTRSIRELVDLVEADTTVAGCDGGLLSTLRRDTRLWMLLSHGVLLQLERRGRMAHEDEALLVTGLLPLLSALSSRTGTARLSACASGSADARSRPTTEGGAEGEGAADDAAAWPAWADPAAAQELLLLLASGLLAVPWSREQVYMAVQRHAALCARLGERDTSADEALCRSVARMRLWFATDRGAPGGASSSHVRRDAAAAHDVWGFPGSAHSPTSPTAAMSDGFSGGVGINCGRSATALPRICDAIDAHLQQNDAFLRQLSSGAGGAPEKNARTADGGPAADLTEEMVEAYFQSALDRHAHVTADFTSAAGAYGLLMVVGAYRTLSRSLYGLRASLEEQRRMARDDDFREFVGRSATFCASDDINTVRALLTVVHRCVFVDHCQPMGLLRLWLGYLQHLFLCVVPLPSSSCVGDGGGRDETLTLMPSSWQRRHHVVSLFGSREYRTGWRALQHDGAPSSHTRLREVLGECLADLLVMPYHTPGRKLTTAATSQGFHLPAEEAPAAASMLLSRTSAVLQHTLPHAVLEVLCELLHIPMDACHTDGGESVSAAAQAASAPGTSSAAAVEACGAAIEKSFLGLAGLLAFLRRLELLMVPGSLQDRRLEHLLRCIYVAADAAAVGV
ncbi:hypothetical protein ABL78_4926 [Leptomonas seymouri]|uniref:Uncharacterized protein n=1 Tax=Leptomonas seymouri TaxID=5684 RepID=A0A0N1HVX0_LEPSE|nr:hypothetical protein ABL78_4926 [Leptomonas seymouri]|eukprot:KPI86023.1 hypothetical protein ABL78_4926 [Leptomonas seymouri]